MSERRRMLSLMGIMAVGGVLLALLCRTSVHQQGERFADGARS